MLCTDVCNGVDLQILRWDPYHKKILLKLRALPLDQQINFSYYLFLKEFKNCLKVIDIENKWLPF